jgi:hypothetical protein
MSRGLSLVDSVTLHTVEVNGTRMVTLQGSLTERFFSMHSARPLGVLPESCQPPREIPFIVAGAAPGGFHLVKIKPSRGMGVGGELAWGDSRWNHDQIHFTGIMYSVSDHALTCSTLDNTWSGEDFGNKAQLLFRDFGRYLIKKYGSVQAAWKNVFDAQGAGVIGFTSFSLGCKASGYIGSATRLWAALDTDRSGNISMEEMFAILTGPPTSEAPALPGTAS